jgi:hypothetical protein
MLDGTRMSRGIPLNGDLIAFFRRSGGYARWDIVTVDVASDVVGRDVGDGAVGGWHTDGHLVSGRDAIDPELVEVLVSSDG